ncbi:MAG: hypothetical protein JW779_04425 [Candidatus Thorarchaeota archaeon]|nr:hypothetical protein [Candidatus Thorarchaeota archaeon]
MSDDVNERLREKTVQIVSLNQKMEALQAQLTGSQRRANQLGSQVSELESTIVERESEIQMLKSELAKTKGALDTVGREIQEIKSEQTQLLAKKKPGGETTSLKDELTLAQMTIERLRTDLQAFSKAATAILNDEEGSRDRLKEILLEFGDPKYRILNMVLARKSIRLEEIASTLVTDMTQALKYVEDLQTAGEVEIKDGNTVFPAGKYRELKVPKEEWKLLEPSDIFFQLEEFVGKTDDSSSIIRAIETAVEILEQKMARGGALIFQMRRTADSWRKQPSNLEELRYTIRDWKGRAQALA